MKQSFAVPTLLALAYGAAAVWTEAQQGEIKYTSVAGYFLQDDPKTNPDGFDYVRGLGRLPVQHHANSQGLIGSVEFWLDQ